MGVFPVHILLQASAQNKFQLFFQTTNSVFGLRFSKQVLNEKKTIKYFYDAIAFEMNHFKVIKRDQTPNQSISLSPVVSAKKKEKKKT
jgi:hypothetical protein